MRQLLILVIAIVIIITSGFFIKVPYTLSCSGKLLPAREWVVRSMNGGDIVSIYNYQASSPIYDFTDYKFDRGEIANFNFLNNFSHKTSLIKGDTIGIISSYLLDERLVQLKSALNQEEANLLALNTGEKNPLVEAAKNEYLLAQQEYELQEKNYNRQRQLYEKQVIPASEYDIALKDYELSKTNIELTKNRLIAIQTGEKPELINYSIVKIKSLKEEIGLLHRKQKQYMLIAPFSGKILTKKVALNNPEALTYHIFHLIDTTEYIALLPIEIAQRKYINPAIKISASIIEGEHTESGIYVGEDQDVELAGNYKQVFVIKGSFKNVKKEIPYGIYASCTINCGNVSLFELIRRKLKI
ncbi:MAG: hypothetical protein U0W24_13005 [Bacteroidales bacterium]